MKSEKELDFINVGKTAEAMKSAGFFIMFEHGGNHYAMTETFILRLRPRDAFRLQCKLEVECFGVWYQRVRGCTVTADRKAEIETYAAKYETLISEALNRGETLTPTGLTVDSFNDCAVDAALFAGEHGYAAIRNRLLEMLGIGSPEIVRAGDTVVVNGSQVIAVLNDPVWQENPYVAKREGGSKQ
ncbi:hypothetical protein [Selenomonas artemidis]|jgi:hypothetical protein|uniref:hypothetical protein n=1 Tax=Selenomonas artemidis TaxID=671224 RepID=UPI002061E4FB|nr:hypothetical protein [Selenomonas artemidis]DAF35370.1 MAG TPA: hypothetical protein [Caudoviricetes sp.]